MKLRNFDLNLLVIVEIVLTELSAAVPSRFAEWSEVRRQCATWPLPFESPRFAMRMAWHKVHDNDPAHKWLRNLL